MMIVADLFNSSFLTWRNNFLLIFEQSEEYQKDCSQNSTVRLGLRAERGDLLDLWVNLEFVEMTSGVKVGGSSLDKWSSPLLCE
jgi:hypothetical protein